METTRAKITGTVGELRENVNRAVDWREQVKTHPGAALGAAATGGILLGHWLGAKMAPGRLAPEHRQERMPTSASSGRDALERLVDSSRVPSFGPRESRVIDELGDTVEKAAIPPLIARVRGFLLPSPEANPDSG